MIDPAHVKRCRPRLLFALGWPPAPRSKSHADVDARAIAKLKGYDFGGHHETARDYSVPVFFVPDDTLLQDEALSLGIRCVQDLYGGVVPYPFVKTKAITRQ